MPDILAGALLPLADPPLLLGADSRHLPLHIPQGPVPPSRA